MPTTIEPSSTIAPSAETPLATPAPAAPPDPTAALTSELEHARQTLANLTRERQITRELFAHGATDLDIASAMIERDLAASPGTDVPTLVAQLKLRKPSLFRRPGGLDSLRLPEPAKPGSRPPTMIQHPAPAESDRDRAAQSAAASNSRTSLLHYMRLKRQPAD
jgi:hypothetical protein